MKKIALILCNDMHMDIEKANELLNCIFQDQNYMITCNYTEADIIIIMTCAFGTGKTHSMYVIADVQRNVKKNAKIIVTGCLVKTNQSELESIPDIIVRPFSEIKNSFSKPQGLKKLISQNKVIISSGCLKHCSYCVYPLIDSTYVSKPMETILKEVESLYDNEITIYITGGLETSDYGIDIYGSHKFAELMDTICTKYPNCNYVIGWFHPTGLTDDVLSVIEKHKNIVEIMVHIQHVSDHILRNMNRPSFEFTNKKLEKLRTLRSDIIISSEVIVGFPGETDNDFNELIQYLDLGIFQDIGVASYEPVLGTKAATLQNLPPLEVRLQRMEYIKNRYNCTTYPTSKCDFAPVLSNYINACEHFKHIPKMLIKTEERQTYSYVAGTDTKSKTPQAFSKLLAEVFERIISSRDSLSIEKLKRFISNTYTIEFRQYLYTMFKESDLKPALIKRAKIILLD